LKSEYEELGQVAVGAATTDACTFQEAMKRARAWLDANVKGDALAALRADPQAKSAAGLITIAGGAAVSRRMSAAVAALVEAVTLEPDNALALADLAAALAMVGLCSEAVAVADLALTKAKEKAGPMGIPVAAVAHNARGYALLRQGKSGEAAKALRQAVALGGPRASDAALNLACALKKEGEEEEAKNFFLGSCWRHPVPQPVCSGGKTGKPGAPPPGPFDEGVTTRAPASVVFDLSHGKTAKLPTFKHPQNLSQLKAFSKFVDKQEKERAEFFAQNTAADAARGKPGENKNRRAEVIWFYIKTVYVDPEVAPAYHAMKEGDREMHRITKPILDAGSKRAREINASKGNVKELEKQLVELSDGLIAQLNGPLNTYETLVRNYWDAARKVESGLAANIGPPFWHDRAVWEIRDDMWTTWITYLLAPLRGLYGAAQHVAVIPEEGKLELPEKGPEGDDPPDCPPGLGVEFSAGPLSVSFSCESMGVELSTEGPLKGFASFETTWEGKMTVFAGAKLELEGKGILPGFAVSDGIYITGDKNGVTDVGGRVSFESSKEIAGVKVKASIDQMDFSLMPRVN